MQRIFIVLLALPFLIGCSEKPKPEILVLPESTTDEQLAEKLKGLVNLETLNLSYTKITDTWLVHLKGFTNLETLDLRWCEKITDKGLVHLKGLSKLESLNLNGTKITDAGVKSIQESLPDCKIDR